MSFNIGVSGLNSANKQIETISQNISNSNTAGYKSARTDFASLYAGGDPGGVEVSRVSQNFDRDGGTEFTGRDLDMAISGSGFFMTQAPGGETNYTRAGLFTRDSENFITTADGQRLQGYNVNAAGDLVTGTVDDLQLGTASIPAQASSQLEFAANFKADSPSIPATPAFDPANSDTFNFSYSSTVYDSLGSEHTLTQYMVKDSANNWTVHKRIDGTDVGSHTMTFNPDGTLASPASPVSIAYSPSGADPMNIDMDLSGTSQYSGSFSVSKNNTDGYQSGEVSGMRVDDDGKIYSLYTNGREQIQGQVILGDFRNPEGLEQTNGTAWKASFASGNAAIGKPGQGSLGTLTSGAFEGSNVDLTGELVDLVSAQRNFQSNAKVISAADETNQVLLQSV